MKKIMNWINKIFRNKNTKKIRFKINDESNLADIYLNNKKTNVKMLMWKKEDVKRLQKIAEKIYQTYK